MSESATQGGDRRTAGASRARASEPDGDGAWREEGPSVNRKLIRPKLDQHVTRGGARTRSSRPPAAEQAGLEGSFLARASAGGGRVVVTLEDGEVLRGVVEWNDRDCLELRRKDEPAIVVMKHAVVHVAPDGAGRRG